MDDFYLSVVATSRNDNHGGSLLYRMQCFVDGFIEQCKRHDLRAELILVEWNPPADRPPFKEALKIPKDKGPCEIRIIKVPKEFHDTLDHSEALPLFQMLGKNVGIRRARGKFILSTNIDILFSDPLFDFFKNKKLKSGILYRVDRFDIPPEIPKFDSFEEILKHCKKNSFRIHKRSGSLIKHINRWEKIKVERIKKKNLAISILKNLIKSFARETAIIFKFLKAEVQNSLSLLKKNPQFILKVLYRVPNFFILFIEKLFNFFISLIENLLKFLIQNINNAIIRIRRLVRRLSPKMLKLASIHTNACGDFTLLSRKDWETLRGYPEWPIFSWHLDSLFLYQAIFGKIRQVNFGIKEPIYHIEHGKGSGYTPEGHDLLFNRLKKNKVTYLDNAKLEKLTQQLWKKKRTKSSLNYNKSDWGLLYHKLEEFIL